MTRRQHYLFAQKYLPKVFYQNPNLVIEYLRNDMGAKYLSRLWQNTADEFSLDKTDVVDPSGLSIDYRENEDYGLIIISLPSPEVSPEAYFVAMWSSYSSKCQGETFRYFTLELEDDIDLQDNEVSGVPPTMFCERSREGKHINHGNGSGANLNTFVESIKQLLVPRRRLSIASSDNYIMDDPDSAERPPRTNYVPMDEPTSLEQIQEMMSRKSHVQVFEGMFKPPVISVQTTPIKVAGVGYCETQPEGLKVKGFKQTPQLSSVQLAIAFLALFYMGSLIGGLVGWAIKAGGVVLLYSASKGQGTDHKNECLELIIPWDNVSSARFDKTLEAVIINVKNFQHQKKSYKGALFFHPSTKPSNLLDALQSHNVNCELDTTTKVVIFCVLFVIAWIFIFIFLIQGAYFSAFLLALATVFTLPETEKISFRKIPVLRSEIARWILYVSLVSMAVVTYLEHTKLHGMPSSPSHNDRSHIRRRGRKR
jgi:hypothetical protein